MNPIRERRCVAEQLQICQGVFIFQGLGILDFPDDDLFDNLALG